jgi:DNA-directed RNA polymerase specialized sigma24 family protein
MPDRPTPRNPDRTRAVFPATRWSLIARVQACDADSAAALEEICRSYWYPLYAFLRRSGVRPHDAEDVTQSFFLRVLSKEILHAASAEKGTLRSFLLTSLKHHLANHCRAANAAKRGGGHVPLPIEWNEAEKRYSVEPVEALDPEKLYARAWARGLFENVQTQVRAAYIASHPAGNYAAIESHLFSDEDRVPYRELAAQLGSTEGSLRLLIYRMRRKFRELLEEEVARTVADPVEIPGELAWLRATLAQR